MKVFQIVYGDIPDIIIPCMESVKRFYPDVNVYRFPEVNNPVIDSDKFRIEMLSDCTEGLFIDWDITLFGKLDMGNNGHLSCNFFRGTPDYSIIYSPDKKIWLHFESERVRRGISKEVYGWPRKILRDMNINEITKNYKHLRYTSSRRYKNGEHT